MKIINKTELDRMKEWSLIKGRKLLFYHNDPDGIASAALWMKSFPDFEPLAREGPIMQPGFVRWISDQDPDVIVFLDLPVDQEWRKLKWLEKNNPDLHIIIIDHHIPDRDVSSKRMIHINNKFVSGLKEKYIPASYLVYGILHDMGYDNKALKWITGAGIIGDFGQKDCAVFFRGMRSKMGIMKKVSDTISAAITLKGRKGADRVLKTLLRESGPDDFLKRKTLKMWKRFVDDEIKSVIKDYEKEKESFPEFNMEMYRMKSKLNISSIISTKLSERSPDKIFVIYKLSRGGLWKASLRMQNGNIDLGTITKKCIKGIGTGGGHKQAAGARVQDWDKFRKRLLSALKKQ